jgi:hypothetical protein
MRLCGLAVELRAARAAETDRLAEELTGRNGGSPIETIRARRNAGRADAGVGVALGPRLSIRFFDGWSWCA